jgi:hypothetical protein
MLRGAFAIGVFGLIGAACSQDPGWQLSTPSQTTFKDDVYPVLIRDCAFQTCHGSEDRFFRVWGPGRVRLSSMSSADDPLTTEEVNANYARAVSLVDGDDPKNSLILRKPLAVEAGGAGHLGIDNYGRNVYRSIDSEGYLMISRWVFSISD